MPLDSDIQNKLAKLAELFAADATKNLRMLLNTYLTISYKKLSASRMHGEQINIKENSVLLLNPFEDASLGSISILVKEKDGNTIADLMMGGSGDNSVDFDETRQMAFNEAVSQSVKAIIERLSGLNGNVDLSLKNSEYLLLSPVKKNTLKVPETVKDSIAISFSFEIPNLYNWEFDVEINAETLNKLIPEFYEAAAEIDIISILEDSNEPLSYQNDKSDEEIAASIAGVNFANIKDHSDPTQINEERNLNLLLDIKMGLIVELGRADMPLKDILKLTKGSVIELDRLSGEPVDLFVNNKLIARGEVVVIDDNFGLRITQLAGNLNLRQELGTMLTAEATSS
jgi:flagellar motor switch protein FliN